MKHTLFIVVAMAMTAAVYFFTPTETTLKHDCLIGETICVMKNDKISITLSMTPRPISPSKPIHYQVTTTNIKPDAVSIHLVGESMHMEEDFFNLKNEGSSWQSVRNFPLCSEKKMIWRLVLILRKGRHYWRSYFDLNVLGRSL